MQLNLEIEYFFKKYAFSPFAKNIRKNLRKKLRDKYIQNLLDHAKLSATDAFKAASKRVIQKHQKQLVI